MKKFPRIVLVLLVLLTVMSCTTFKFEGAQVTTEIPSYNAVGDFDITVKVHEFLGASGGTNLLNVSADAMNTKI